ncbi:hypothetical protein TNCV_679381 [Trichonephila clavipes]|nr:hypothetical protein TNCV_679381 [Trichonephila clavipes]
MLEVGQAGLCNCKSFTCIDFGFVRISDNVYYVLPTFMGHMWVYICVGAQGPHFRRARGLFLSKSPEFQEVLRRATRLPLPLVLSPLSTVQLVEGF